ASLVRPHDVVVDQSGNIFFSTTSNLVSGASSYRIRKVDTNGTISTVAGNGKSARDFTEGEPATEASLNAPTGICLDTQGNLYIASVRDQAIRKVDHVSPTPPVSSNNLALTLDGRGDFAQIDGSFTFSETNQITLEAWFKLTNPSSFESVISAGLNYRLMIDGGLHPYWNAGLHGDRSDNTFVFTPGQWYHYVLVIEGGTEAKIYVDGTLINAHTSHIPETLPDVSQFLIGAGESSDLYNLFGQIDEVRIWNIARTEQELQDARTKTLIGNEHGLVGYWTFNDQNQSTEVIDHSTANNKAFLGGDAYLTLSTSPVSGESPPQPDTPNPPDPSVETTWHPIETGTEDVFFSVYFTDTDHGWAVGGKGQILATTDGGITSLFQESGINSFSLYGLHFIDNQTGWIAGDRGTLLHTADGGATWIQQSVGTSLKLSDVHFIDADIGWAGGDWRTMFHTTDGGNTWTKQTVPNMSGPHIIALHMLNEQTGWATGGTSTGKRSLIGTRDGGNTWTMLIDGPGALLRDLYFINENEGWIVGDSGLIHYSNDGGQSWVQQTSGVSEVLQGVRFVNAQTGWVVGSNGTLLHTTDGGTTWAQHTVETTETLTDVWIAADQTSGWITGYNGVLLTFGDSTTQPDPPSPSEADIHVPGDYVTIQDAINAANAGQTISVAAGTYVENISLKENVAIIGAGAESTTIDGGGSDVVYGADGASVSGFTLTNGGDSGVFAWSTSPTVENCIITNCDQGIATAADAIIHSNIIVKNSGYGIFAGTSSTIGRPASPTITNNLILQNGSDASGITLYQAGGLVINNTIDANGTYGINVSKGPDPISIEIKNNLVTNNGWYGINGYEFDNVTQISNYNNVWNNAWDNYDDLLPGPNSGSEDPLYVTPLARPTSKRAITSRKDMSEEMASSRNHINDMRAQNLSTTQYRRARKQTPRTPIQNFNYHLQTTSPCIDAGDPLPHY
ncbi:MAG: hypothetical protein HOE48_01200, partial [Candidatus Latescibacteria bacterium]|nr:hypothetical protein [Candidatus Latescibacterota bacterium]